MDTVLGRFKNWLGISPKAEFYNEIPAQIVLKWEKLSNEYSIRDLAFETAINKIAKIVSKAEIKVYKGDMEIREEDYWRLNYQPNKNQNRPMWINKIVSQLYRNGEVLIIEVRDDLLVVDSFTKEKRALLPWKFTDVVVDELMFEKTFYTEDSIYISLNHQNIKRLIDSVYNSYSKMMDVARDIISSSGGIKGILTMDGLQSGTKEEREALLKSILDEKVKPLWESRHAVSLFPKGWDFKDLQNQKEWAGSRDYRSMIDDIFEMTASAFGIPTILIKGQTEGRLVGIDDVYDIFLTECIDPVAELISNALTGHMFNRKSILSGRRVVIDTSRSKHFDMFDSAASIEKLIGSGLVTINELRERVGYSRTDDKAGDIHFITKNFGTAQEAARNEEGKNED